MPDHPGGQMSRRPLQFIWILDCSGSMQGKNISALNYAISEAIVPMQNAAAERGHNAQVFVRAIRFADGAQWHIDQPVKLEQFEWKDLSAGGVTDMGQALRLAAEALSIENMARNTYGGGRGLPPVLALVSDGYPTDDFQGGLKALLDQPWGKKAVRVAIAIGDGPDLNLLEEFIADPTKNEKPMVAENVQDLANKIKFVSTVVLGAAASPQSLVKDGQATTNIVYPAPPPTAPPDSANDVF